MNGLSAEDKEMVDVVRRPVADVQQYAASIFDKKRQKNKFKRFFQRYRELKRLDANADPETLMMLINEDDAKMDVDGSDGSVS